MIIHENAEISVEVDSWDRVTVTNKRSNVNVSVIIGGADLIIDPKDNNGNDLIQRTIITQKGVIVVEKKEN